MLRSVQRQVATDPRPFNSLLEMQLFTSARLVCSSSISFQFSIGDAGAPFVGTQLAEVMSFQFSIGDALIKTHLPHFFAKYRFQFSIGDAWSCGVLNVWVFEFFVCVLACWCLAGLFGLLCLVCR